MKVYVSSTFEDLREHNDFVPVISPARVVGNPTGVGVYSTAAVF